MVKNWRDFFKIPHIDNERQAEIRENIQELSRPKRSYYLMVCLSAIIAAYGLLSNSAAVIIGAMLVAPLMIPIFGIALSFSINDRTLLKYSLFSEMTGTFMVLFIAFLIGLVPIRPDIGSEIISRTQPNIYDIIIALASGLAGTYALVDKRLSPALAGVAIATALVPPLATCGLCLSAGKTAWAVGAFSLFFINLISIELAAGLIFWGFGIIPDDIKNNISYRIFFRKFGARIIILFLIAIVMTFTLTKIIKEKQYHNRLKMVITREIEKSSGARLLDIQYKKTVDTTAVTADILAPREFDISRVKKVETVLQEELDPKVYLIVRSVASKGVDRNGPVFLTDTEQITLKENEEKRLYNETVSKIISENLKKYPGAQLDDIIIEPDNIMAFVRTPKEINPRQVLTIQEMLNKIILNPPKLVIRSTITRDADSERYLYEETNLSADEIVLSQKIKEKLNANLIKISKNYKLVDFKYFKEKEDIILFALIYTPKIIESKNVKNIESSINKAFKIKSKLIIRCIVGQDVGSSGYINNFNEWKYFKQ